MKQIFFAIITSLIAIQSFADIACKGSIKGAEIRIDGNQMLILPKKMVAGDLSYVLEESKNFQITTYDYQRSTNNKEFYTTLGADPGRGTTFVLNILDTKTTLLKETCVGRNVNPQHEDIVRSVFHETRKATLEYQGSFTPKENVILECVSYIDNGVDSCGNIK